MADGRATLLHNTIADGIYPLPGYTRRQFARGEVVAAECVIDELTTIVTHHGTLYAWAKGQPQSRALRGRAPVYVATIPDEAHTTVVIRHVWHGGLLAPITRDRFRRPTRAPVELLRAFMLRECGIPTPELMGFALYDAGPGFARVDVATRYVPDSNDFGAVLAQLAPEISREEAMDAVRVLLNQLSRNGFTHPDLNVKNILLQKKGVETHALVLDVDVMRWDPNLPAASIMQLNTERLLRSLMKVRRQFGITFTDAERTEFVQRMTYAESVELRPQTSAPASPAGSPRS
ncbi:MAG: hypothetical protein H7Z40_20365 [Phycisphaerae bacterium]|nr:hypothetical protein [Gemmatimonadaceae bacterium]